MESFALELHRRAEETLGAAVYALQEGGANGTNSTAKAFIHNIRFAASKSIRTSTVILAAFNITAALATALRIIYDCYWASKRNNPSYKKSKIFFWDTIHPAETFSLVLAGGIVLQGGVFAAAQGEGLEGLFTDGCATIAQFMLPAIFLVPLIQLVFGAECALRSLRASPFPARGKWNVPILLVTVVLMEIGVWIPTHLDPETDHCFASLVWFVEHFGQLSLQLLSITGGLTIIFAVIIFYRLTTITSINQAQRTAASRMVYHLVLAVVSLAFVMPWFVTLTLKRPSFITSMMATVVLNLTGLMTGLLQLFLRSNSATTSFRPRGVIGWVSEDDDRQIQLSGPNGLGFGGHMLQPVSGPRSPSTIGSRSSLVGIEKGRLMSMDSLRSQPFTSLAYSNAQTTAIMPTVPETTIISPSRGHAHKQSYSIFPSESTTSPMRANAEAIPTVFLPSSHFSAATQASTPAISISSRLIDATSPGDLKPMYYFDENSLTPPRPIFSGRGHRRDSSMASSATVQIGLRLSNMLGPIPQSASSETYPTNSATGISPLRRPNSPNLQLQTRNLTASPLTQQTNIPSPDLIKSPPLSKADRDARMKTLPPVPRVPSARYNSVDVVKEEEKGLQLSPTVYSPLEGRKYSPTTKTAVGNGAAMKGAMGTDTSTKSPSQSSSRPTPSTLGPRATGSSRASKVDWI